jgi:hypothetical protein
MNGRGAKASSSWGNALSFFIGIRRKLLVFLHLYNSRCCFKSGVMRDFARRKLDPKDSESWRG